MSESKYLYSDGGWTPRRRATSENVRPLTPSSAMTSKARSRISSIVSWRRRARRSGRAGVDDGSSCDVSGRALTLEELYHRRGLTVIANTYSLFVTDS